MYLIFFFYQMCFVLILIEIGSVVRRKIFKYFVIVSWLFCSYLTMEKGVALHLDRPKSPLPWILWALELTERFWGRFLNVVNVILLFHYYLLEKGIVFHWKKLCGKFGWNLSSVLEKKMKMWKVYNQTDITQITEKFAWASSYGELKTVDQKGKSRKKSPLLQSMTVE